MSNKLRLCSSAIFRKMSKTIPLFLLSRLPVGSSPMMISGSLMSDRAMATRCF
jgi:hypothetical protein